MIDLVRVKGRVQLDHIRALFKEYARSLNFDLRFQNFNDELTHLPGEYEAPAGYLLLALYEGNIAGCAALRKIDKRTCEMKRMYVRPEYRRKGIARAMAEEIIEFARSYGYECMRLDTIDTMDAAISLYRSLGFVKASPYRYNPIKGASYMELSLIK